MEKSFILPRMQKYKTQIWNRNLNKTDRFLSDLSMGMHALHFSPVLIFRLIMEP